jgi:hypothetical protein
VVMRRGRWKRLCARVARPEWSSGPSASPLDAMSHPFALTVCLAFGVLALWHFYMALMPGSGEGGAVPSVKGKPLFVPSRKSTVAVGVVLLLFAGLVAATAGIVSVGLPRVALSWLSYVLAFGLLARGVGDFRYVGLFKRVRGTKFATLDTLVYSPLCLLLAAGVAIVTLHDGT